jgi:hypothetical protein
MPQSSCRHPGRASDRTLTPPTLAFANALRARAKRRETASCRVQGAAMRLPPRWLDMTGAGVLFRA